MTKYKNVFLSLGSYVLAFCFYYYGSQYLPAISTESQIIRGLVFTFDIIIYLGLIFFGMYFARTGYGDSKKMPLANSILIIVGLLFLVFSLMLFVFLSGF